MNRRVWVLLAATLAAVFIVYLFPAIPQNEAYHQFADQRTVLGIPNGLNVLSNACFLLVGLPGIGLTLRGAGFLDPRERWPYCAFFIGVTLTAFGSAWYHLDPNNHTLVWDRIPMTIGFLALVAALIAERIDVTTGLWLLLPLIAAGIGTVIDWEITQSRGHGDLRPYAITQFGSLLVMVLLLVLFPARYTRSLDFGISLALYGVAKIFEATDRLVFSIGRMVGGHVIKHILAALSAYWIFRMLRLRLPVSRQTSSA